MCAKRVKNFRFCCAPEHLKAKIPSLAHLLIAMPAPLGGCLGQSIARDKQRMAGRRAAALHAPGGRATPA